jgi:hypothetical protein
MTDKIILKVTAIVSFLTFGTIASVLGFAALTGTNTSAFAQKQGQFFDAKPCHKEILPLQNSKDH